MIKFIHKKHFHKPTGGYKFIIYYDMSEIVLGVLLVSLVGFFVYNYLQNNLAYKQAEPYPVVQSSNPAFSTQKPTKIKR